MRNAFILLLRAKWIPNEIMRNYEPTERYTFGKAHSRIECNEIVAQKEAEAFKHKIVKLYIKKIIKNVVVRDEIQSSVPFCSLQAKLTNPDFYLLWKTKIN